MQGDPGAKKYVLFVMFSSFQKYTDIMKQLKFRDIINNNEVNQVCRFGYMFTSIRALKPPCIYLPVWVNLHYIG
jgi:hypothetical protein